MIIHLVTDRFCLGGGIEHIYQIVKGIGQHNFRIFALASLKINAVESEKVREKFSKLKHVTLCDAGFDPATVLTDRPDLVHIHHLRPLFHFFRYPWNRYSIPLIFTAHGMHLHKYEFSTPKATNRVGNRVKYFLRFQLEKRLFARVNQVIAVSREDQNFMENRYGLRNVTYLTNGIDLADVSITDIKRDELRKSLKLPADHFLFVTVARFNFQKAYDFLIKTLYRLKDFLNNRRVKFILVGGGAELNAIKIMAEKLGVSSHIVFAGERSDARLYMQAADIFLLPSRWEGLPIVILECGLLNVPVIASDTYGNREILKANNGVLFRNLDSRALAEVIKNATQRKYPLEEMSKNLNCEVKQHYDIKTMLSGLERIYHSVIDR